MPYLTRICRSPGCTATPAEGSRRCEYHGIARYPAYGAAGQSGSHGSQS
ncbi:hypothetical protein [Mycolicibacterium brumae]|nr:hypothetical protein [Mycolicibacterium brumae]MCV7194025.1 hypothetical protein [Mycolicibacterium brumae]UWW09698.1 hypothetical protein L2Z93_002809 [Mycolicibacterium brumae]